MLPKICQINVGFAGLEVRGDDPEVVLMGRNRKLETRVDDIQIGLWTETHGTTLDANYEVLDQLVVHITVERVVRQQQLDYENS
jgi:hypothetical protein